MRSVDQLIAVICRFVRQGNSKGSLPRPSLNDLESNVVDDLFCVSIGRDNLMSCRAWLLVCVSTWHNLRAGRINYLLSQHIKIRNSFENIVCLTISKLAGSFRHRLLRVRVEPLLQIHCTLSDSEIGDLLKF